MDTNDTRNDLEETHEISPEEPELEDIEEAEGNKLKQMRERLHVCEEEKRKILEESQRTKADFLNARKRLEEQLERDRERITEQHIVALLPLLDSFDAALSDPSWERADREWRTGIEAIYTQLTRLIQNYNIHPIDNTEVEFDPTIHEAMAHHQGEEKVSEIIQKGYRMGERVLRPAKVVVGKSNN